jgi:putative sterol carrier protein
MNAKAVSQALINRFDPAKAKGISAVIQINPSGADDGPHAINIADGQANIVEGSADNPNATIDVAVQDWADINTGKLDPTMAFMSGKLRVGGDLGLMMRFQSMFGI